MRSRERLRVAATGVLFVASASWVMWLVLSAVLPDRGSCSASLVVETGCWSTVRIVSVTFLAAGGAVLFASGMALTFRLVLAHPGHRSKGLVLGRAGALLCAVATAGALMAASFGAYRHGADPARASLAHCERVATHDVGACVVREMQRSDAEVFLRRVPAVIGLTIVWAGALALVERAARYRKPVARAHSSR